MASSRDLKKSKVLSELVAKRKENVKKASTWKAWEIEEQIERTLAAKQSFIEKDPQYDLSIINEHLSQLVESLELKNNIQTNASASL